MENLDPVLVFKGILGLIAIAIVAAIAFWFVVDWGPDYPFPWNWLSNYYYLVVKWPITAFLDACGAIVDFFWQPSITPFPNLNIVLGLIPTTIILVLFFFVSMILYVVAMVPMMLVGIFVGAIADGPNGSDDDAGMWAGCGIFVLPAIFAVVVSLGMISVEWLFATPVETEAADITVAP